jgi:hypothetical protein
LPEEDPRWPTEAEMQHIVPYVFYVTFGDKYRREEHPEFKKAHPDGYVALEADNYLQARNTAILWFGRYWSGLYRWEELQAKMYPLGQLDRITMSETIRLEEQRRSYHGLP